MLELLRPANVVTALADVLAGYAVAGRVNGRVLPWLLASTACLYAGGVVLNDVFDREIDRVERPERPIPSGRVSAATAALLGTTLLLLGVAFAAQATRAAMAVAVVLAASILAYDGWGKRTRLGPVNMGACRGLNLLLGIASWPAKLSPMWPLALLPALHICAVTMISRGEVRGGDRRAAGAALGLAAVVVAALAAIAAVAAPPSVPGLVLAALLGFVVLPALVRVVASPRPAAIRAAVRTGVLALVLLDAVLASVYAGVSFAAVVLATALPAAVLARLFSVT